MSDSEGTEASTSVRASVGKEMSVTAVVVGDEDGVAVTGKGGCGCSSAGVRGSVRALAIVSRRGGEQSDSACHKPRRFDRGDGLHDDASYTYNTRA